MGHGWPGAHAEFNGLCEASSVHVSVRLYSFSPAGGKLFWVLLT